MKLLGDWERVLEEDAERPVRQLLVPRLDVGRASTEVRVLRTAGEAARFVERLRATPLATLAVAPAPTPRFLRPQAVAVAAWATDATVFAAVFDTGVEGVAIAVGAVLGMPVHVVGHDIKPLLLGLWGLGLDPDLPNFTDTYLAAAALHLGEHHPRANRPRDESPAEAIGRRQSLEAERDRLLSLEGQCAHYEIPLPIPPGTTASIPGVEARTLAARAVWTLDVHAAQQTDIARHGLPAHLYGVEFPFALANARMEWHGVHVDSERHERLRAGCARAVVHHAQRLRALGVNPAGNADALLRVLRHAGLEPASVEDAALKTIEGLHPAVREFRLHRRYLQLRAEPWQLDERSRVYPEHRQLAAATGRNSCRRPNLAGIGRVQRPVVTAPPGRALVELDYSQIEVGVAAATYGDPDLVAAYNAGDVYAATAQGFFKDELTAHERALGPEEVRARRPDLREAVKPFVLAVLYGGGPKAIAAHFGISESEATRRIERFLALYQGLAAGIEAEVACGLGRGYATTFSGLRRAIDRSAPEGWTRNVLRNTPVQGGAAIVFKKAVVDLDRAWRGSGVWLVLPLHDAVLIECPREALDEVASRSAQIMRDALHALYPALRPRVVANKSHPECWNKDGRADSLDRWLEDPEWSFERRGVAL